MKGYFHSFNFLTAIFSVLAYLLSAYVNTMAAKIGASYFTIGLINFFAALAYVISSLLFGGFGDRFGHKRFLSFSCFVFSAFLSISPLLKGIAGLFVLAIGFQFFFGSLYPQLVAIVTKNEKSYGVDHAKTVGRYNLSWSFGNIIGMAFGPFLAVNLPVLTFSFGIALCLVVGLFLGFDYKKHRDTFYFNPSKTLKKAERAPSISNAKLYRKIYRLMLFLCGLVYTSILTLFPKVISSHGLPLGLTGFIIVGANLSVFSMFLILSIYRKWVGNIKVSLAMLSVLPITSILLLLPKSGVWMFFLISIFGGMTYATAYTFAIYYGMISEHFDQGKQGGFHEATIGMLWGFGPLAGGLMIQIFKSEVGLGIMGLIVFFVVSIVQFKFMKRVKAQSLFAGD
ncbi:MFS transporter [Pseudothermotoga thermarum]|uniref:Major facilitator superfamily MFS_1 n=1 Tax=Pseudothermotoga thermarum DSM 5069 TaxID=688269 RepID=F7YV45_9THEM|nr:MFS transporter [Pseudothermotoga thermarum]AEH50344.1 major facilitator superfamily MFS_1 [Pseudothermotoga thermarum DSM 5069]